MSHHLDFIEDPRLDITDIYCFRGKNGTVFVVNVSPLQASGFHPEGIYEMKIDMDNDLVEDLTFRFIMPEHPKGGQELRVELRTGNAAVDRDAVGTTITPAGSTLEQVITTANGIRIFAGERGEPFFNDPKLLMEIMHAMKHGVAPNFETFDPASAHNAFGNSNVSSMIVEVPDGLLGQGKIAFWGTTALPTDSGGWRQLQHAAGPAIGAIWDFSHTAVYNAVRPKDQKRIFGEQIVAETAAVIKVLGTHDDPTGHAEYIRDTVFPDVLHYTVGTAAIYDARNPNGRSLVDPVIESIFSLVLNKPVILGLDASDATGSILDNFPYLSDPIVV